MSRTVVALGASLTIALCAAVQADDRISPPAVPTNIEVPAGYNPFLKGHAVGTQNYICVGTSQGYKWLPIGPQATVFDAAGEQILTHFQSKNPFRIDALQATWQHSRDTSAVWATKRDGSSDPNYVAPDAVEWLLLEVTGFVAGPTGGNRLTPARYIQRVNTVGGKEPTFPCSNRNLNTRQLVDYEADYYFYQ